jgi:hypothetical protein
VVPVHDLLASAVAEILRKAPLTPEKVAFAWRTAVGPAVDRVTSAAWQGGILRVRARDTAWQRELERSAVVIRARLDAMLGAGVVRYIDVTAETESPVQEQSRSAGGSGTGRSPR